MKRLLYILCITLAFAGWFVASWPTLCALHPKWMDVGDSYVLGYPLLLAAGWLIYQRRRELLSVSVKASWCGVLLFLASMLLIYAARLVQLQIVQQIMLPTSLWCLIFALFGFQVARIVLLPIALQYFGMPVWDFLIVVLQQMTIAVAHVVLAGMQIPFRVQANHIHLPDGIITVADSCSGLNLLLAMLLITTLQAEMGRYDIMRRIGLFAAATVIGLIDNWIRVVALILIAHYSHMQSELVYSHASFGWWIYAASLLPFFWLAHRFEHGVAVRFVDQQGASSAVLRIPHGQIVALVAIVVACEGGATVLSARVGGVRQMQVAGSAQFVEPEFLPHYSGYDLRQSWELIGGGDRYELSALVYTRQQGSKKLIYYENVIAPEAQLGAADTVRLGTSVLNFAVVNAARSRVVWWYYWVDGAMTTSPMRAKLYQLKAALIGDPSAALIVLSRRCSSDDCRDDVQRMRHVDQTVLAQMLSIKGGAQASAAGL